MSDEAPIDLRSLGDVSSPDVVRAALRDFRRRALHRYVWIGIVIALAALATIVFPPQRGLDDRIGAAEGAPVGYSFDVGDSAWTLVRVADLGDTLGLQFVVRRPPPDPGGPSWWLQLHGQRSALATSESGSRTSDMAWFEIDRPSGGVVAGSGWYDSGCEPIPGESTCQSRTQRLGPIRIDLRELGVLPSILEG
jgi:hypothetical protein